MTSRAHRHSIAEIKQRLLPRAAELARALGLNGRQSGTNFWVKDPRRSDGGNLTSFSIDTRRGIFTNWAGADESGDLLKLIAVFACNGDNGRAVGWALDWLGLTGKAPDPREAARLQAKARQDEVRNAEELARRRKAAMKLWLESVPLDGRDPASCYLRARGVDVGKLREGIPHALRFHKACMAKPEGVALPAMIACVSLEGHGINGFVAAHRTYLDDSGGGWAKAFKGQMRDGRPVAAKRALGAYAGGSVRLTRGASGKNLSDAPAGEWIAIGEGIENVLTANLAKPDLRCLSAVGGSNLGHVVLPKQIGGVYLLADNDTESAAIAMLDKAMDAFAARGIEPAVVRVGAQYKDLNDALLGKERA